MGLFGESKHDIISRYEKVLKEKDYMIDRLQSENQLLKNEVACKQRKIDEWMSNQKEYIQSDKTDELILCAGKYKGGINIPVGIYDLQIVSGTGIIDTKKPNEVFIVLNHDNNSAMEYRGLEVTDETVLNISDTAKIKFMFSNNINFDKYIEKYIKEKEKLKQEILELDSIKKSKMNKNDILILGEGTYYGGKTIPCGIYNLKVISGSSFVETKNPKKYFNIGKDNEYYSDSYIGLEIGNETTLKISHDAKIEFYQTLNQEELESFSASNAEMKKKQSIVELQSKIDELKQYKKTLKDSLELIKSEINLNKNKLREIESSVKIAKTENDNESKKYEKLKIKTQNELDRSIKLNEEIKMINYELQRIKNDINVGKEKLIEMDVVNEELNILNNTLIEKYYVFSDYDNVTSSDCKNELLLLKLEEKQLRNVESDIEILTIEVSHKIIERSIRQILRNFNSECDNIMRNISLKNIDVVRNKIQKSFESMNKLYSIDGINLSRKILELKLKQATLMYTYELKYQQEKDIQQAIKEQMLEEARAEREIQEQKKKIEKDLQQHLGEVNRLMKYIQKTQIDAEKQLYMDKIKELEEKIKTLESDKETVLEREANATAGFVYIISNIGSFGEDVYKIGMTRRLEPMDRVRELGSASVPFEFDVHAMIFSSDAPDLENTLHKHFADKAVNKVNPRKEFYKVDIDEIEQIVKENYNDTVQFTKIPIATEYRQSMEL